MFAAIYSIFQLRYHLNNMCRTPRELIRHGFWLTRIFNGISPALLNKPFNAIRSPCLNNKLIRSSHSNQTRQLNDENSRSGPEMPPPEYYPFKMDIHAPRLETRIRRTEDGMGRSKNDPDDAYTEDKETDKDKFKLTRISNRSDASSIVTRLLPLVKRSTAAGPSGTKNHP
ncbi:hypothetical protein RUND412_002637 [Rhizina undulata]